MTVGASLQRGWLAFEAVCTCCVLDRIVIIDGPDSWAKELVAEGKISKFYGMDFTDESTIFERCLAKIKQAEQVGLQCLSPFLQQICCYHLLGRASHLCNCSQQCCLAWPARRSWGRWTASAASGKLPRRWWPAWRSVWACSRTRPPRWRRPARSRCAL